jgi:hypothetical protein
MSLARIFKVASSRILVYGILRDADDIDDGKRFPSRPRAPPFGPGECGPPLEKKRYFPLALQP